jgi:hypothetical protein
MSGQERIVLVSLDRGNPLMDLHCANPAAEISVSPVNNNNTRMDLMYDAASAIFDL